MPAASVAALCAVQKTFGQQRVFFHLYFLKKVSGSFLTFLRIGNTGSPILLPS